MKALKYILLVFLAAPMLASCEKETEGVSRVTAYATFKMEGSDFMFVQSGATFTDPGVSALEGETELTIETSGAVNTAAPGVYVLRYAAKNSDGFSASVQRTVVVVSSIPTTDLSGTYQIEHATRENKITITKNEGLVGYYHATDSWWQARAIPLDFVDMGDGTITILQGSSAYGGHHGTGEILPDGKIKFVVTLVDQGNLVNPQTYYPL
ncbi:MAG: DUF5011 domain-containing protein [Prevotellaceae bacterium]|jgi:hypothetical protein|nr:DUF5011 domain-containing protein [Prevotellaceae bacterium]